MREWVSFEDPDEQRTWVFDATFLRSSYHCIYGAGCKGVLDADATEMEQGCCSYGAHFVDEDDVANVVKHFVRLEPRHMQFYDEAVAAGFLAPGDPSDDGDAGDGDPPRRRRLHLPQPPRVRRRVPAARCTSPRSRPASARSTGSRTCAGSCRCGSSTRPTRTATSRRGCATGSAATGATAATTSTGGAPRRRRPTSASEPVYVSARDEIVELVGAPIYDLLVSRWSCLDWVPRPPALPTSGQLRRRRHSSSSASSSNSTPYLSAIAAYSSSSEGSSSVVVVACGHDHRIRGRTPQVLTASACALLRSGDDDPSSRRAPND